MRRESLEHIPNSIRRVHDNFRNMGARGHIFYVTPDKTSGMTHNMKKLPKGARVVAHYDHTKWLGVIRGSEVTRSEDGNACSFHEHGGEETVTIEVQHDGDWYWFDLPVNTYTKDEV